MACFCVFIPLVAWVLIHRCWAGSGSHRIGQATPRSTCRCSHHRSCPHFIVVGVEWMEIITDEAAGVCHATSDEDKGLATTFNRRHMATTRRTSRCASQTTCSIRCATAFRVSAWTSGLNQRLDQDRGSHYVGAPPVTSSIVWPVMPQVLQCLASCVDSRGSFGMPVLASILLAIHLLLIDAMPLLSVVACSLCRRGSPPDSRTF